jgi:hypothetical protein
MAKRKDSVALFEVITAAKRKQEASAASGWPAPSMLRTPKWWFKSKDARARQPQPAEDPAYTAPALPPGYPPQLAAPAEALPTAPLAAPGQAVVQRVAPAERVTIPQQSEEPNPFGLDIPSSAGPSRRRWQWPRLGYKQLGLDPNRREVTLRFSYTTAIIAGFALCVAAALIVITVRQSNPTAAGAASISSERIKGGPILPGVLDVSAQRETIGIDDSSPPSLPEHTIENQAVRPPAGPTGKNVRTVPGAVESGLPRQIGLNYVIVQSYGDVKTAKEAQQALLDAGIECTVERGPKDWTANPDWYSVVGVRGFTRTESSAEYREYVKSIENAGKKFVRSKYKRFDPKGYQWKPQ